MKKYLLLFASAFIFGVMTAASADDIYHPLNFKQIESYLKELQADVKQLHADQKALAAALQADNPVAAAQDRQDIKQDHQEIRDVLADLKKDGVTIHRPKR